MGKAKKLVIKPKEGLVKLDMTFEQALKKALNTPLPESEKKSKMKKVEKK